jgi:hypothetical protein
MHAQLLSSYAMPDGSDAAVCVVQLAASSVFAALGLRCPEKVPARTVVKIIQHYLDDPPPAEGFETNIMPLVYGTLALGCQGVCQQLDLAVAINLGLTLLQYNGTLCSGCA